MDLIGGRRAAFPAGRLIILVLLVGAVVLLRMRAGGAAHAEGPLVTTAASAAPAVERDSGPVPADPLPGIPAAERAARERALEATLSKWMGELDKVAKGKAHPKDVVVAVHAIELGEARAGVLFSRHADEPLLPASNMKLVTTAAALTLLSPDYAFRTRCEAGGPIAGGVLEGDLIVRAGGDPLTDELGSGQVEGRLLSLAREVQAHGIERVRGSLVLDEGAFQKPAPAEGWPAPAQHWADYCALSGGLTVNGGVLCATLAETQGRLDVRVHPAPHGLRESYGVRLGQKNNVRVGATASVCTVQGEIPKAQAATFEARFAHPDPVVLFGSVFADCLARAGVQVEGGVVRRPAPAGEPLASLATPITEALRPINTHSTNGVADQLFLTLGAEVVGEGSRAGGAEATARALESLGLPRRGFAQADGSGLSRENRASARQIVALLEAVQRMPEVRQLFFDSLAVAGRTGTLEERLAGSVAEGRVCAKTGWIEGASALSGIAHASAGRELLFSILISYPREAGGLNTSIFKPLQDEIVLGLFEDAP